MFNQPNQRVNKIVARPCLSQRRIVLARVCAAGMAGGGGRGRRAEERACEAGRGGGDPSGKELDVYLF